MYLLHFATSTVFQKSFMTFINCDLLVGFTSLQVYSFNSCQRSSIGLRSGDPGGVFHQFMCSCSKMFLLLLRYALDHYPALIYAIQGMCYE